MKKFLITINEENSIKEIMDFTKDNKNITIEEINETILINELSGIEAENSLDGLITISEEKQKSPIVKDLKLKKELLDRITTKFKHFNILDYVAIEEIIEKEFKKMENEIKSNRQIIESSIYNINNKIYKYLLDNVNTIKDVENIVNSFKTASDRLRDNEIIKDFSNLLNNLPKKRIKIFKKGCITLSLFEENDVPINEVSELIFVTVKNLPKSLFLTIKNKNGDIIISISLDELLVDGNLDIHEYSKENDILYDDILSLLSPYVYEVFKRNNVKIKNRTKDFIRVKDMSVNRNEIFKVEV